MTVYDYQAVVHVYHTLARLLKMLGNGQIITNHLPPSFFLRKQKLLNLVKLQLIWVINIIPAEIVGRKYHCACLVKECILLIKEKVTVDQQGRTDAAVEVHLLVEFPLAPGRPAVVWVKLSANYMQPTHIMESNLFYSKSPIQVLISFRKHLHRNI